MARKKLLTEGEVRQFMKLANLGPLSENYFSNNPLDEQEEEELDLEMGAEEELPGGDEELELDGLASAAVSVFATFGPLSMPNRPSSSAFRLFACSTVESDRTGVGGGGGSPSGTRVPSKK